MNKFFVYGTLRPGEVRWSALEGYAATIEPAVLYGARMYTTGSWPFLVLDGQSTSEIQGEVITVADQNIAMVTRMLDNIEGYTGNPEYDLFIRSVEHISITGMDPVEAGHERAYVYLGGFDLARAAQSGSYRRIESGDWKKRNESNV